MTNGCSWRQFAAAARVWALAGILLSAAWGRAEDAPEPRHRMENRFLFVIDTSSAMKSRASGVEEAVTGLLASDMKGELRKGDTIGVWTYNDRLNTDFPRQIWSEEKKDDILSEVRAHLRAMPYENRAHLDKVMPAINQVVAKSERLTVILVFDGADLIKGTPFDKDINDLHKEYFREFKTAQAPFVTLLAARKGAVFDYSINYPGAVVVPHTADPLPPPEPPPVAISPPPAPVIVSPPAEPPPEPRRIQIVLSGSNFARNASAPPPAAGNLAAVAMPATVPVSIVASNAPPPVEAQVVNTNVATPEPAQPLPPAPAVAAPAMPVPAASPVTPAAAPVLPAVAATSPIQQAAMFVMAFSLLTIAVVLVLFLVRRSRGSPPSLISQSIDRSR